MKVKTHSEQPTPELRLLAIPSSPPPSAMASSTSATNAGPDPASAVHVSKYFSSKNRALPHDMKMASRSDRWCASDSGVMTVMPAPTWKLSACEIYMIAADAVRY